MKYRSNLKQNLKQFALQKTINVTRLNGNVENVRK